MKIYFMNREFFVTKRNYLFGIFIRSFRFIKQKEKKVCFEPCRDGLDRHKKGE